MALGSLFALRLVDVGQSGVAALIPVTVLVAGATTIVSTLIAGRALRWSEMVGVEAAPAQTADDRLADGRLQTRDHRA